MSDVKDQITPETRYGAGKQAYQFAARLEKVHNQIVALAIPATVLLVANKGLIPVADKFTTQFYPNVINQDRENALMLANKKIADLNAHKNNCQDILVEDRDGHYNWTTIEQKKQEVSKTIMAVKKQPEKISDPSASSAAGVVSLIPALIMLGVMSYKVYGVHKPLRRKMERFIKTESVKNLGIEIWHNPSEIREKINDYASEHNLPQFEPPKPKKVLGLF